MSGGTITVRKADTSDAAAIAAIHRDTVAKVNSKFYPPMAIKEWLAEITEESVKAQFDRSIWIVAEDEGKTVGFGQYSLDDGEIDQIYVLPEMAGRGYGRAIFNSIEKDFSTHGIDKITLNATLNAVDFYKRLGFKPSGKVNFKLNSASVEMMRMVRSI